MAHFLLALLKSFFPQAFRAARLGVTLSAGLLAASLLPAAAQTSPPAAAAAANARPPTAKPPPSKKPDPYGSPLDTIMSTHLWADVPPAQPFVDATRPDPKSLDYAPLTGTDPARPTPRDPKGVAALQAELEAGGAKNAARAQGLQTPAKAARRVRKAKPVAARE